MIEIIKEEVDGLILTVLASVRLRVRVSEKIRFVKSSDIAELLKDKYEIISTVKENQLSNSMRGGGKQKGQYMFQIREKVKPAPRKRSPQKKQPAIKKPPAPKEHSVEAPTPEPEVPTKTSTKPSIRGRMSKIAKNKLDK